MKRETNSTHQIDILIFGAGGHAKAASDCARSLYPRQLMLSGDGTQGQWHDVPILPQSSQTLEEWRERCPLAFAAIGDAAQREALLASLEAAGFTLATLVHPSAVVSPSAQLGPGTMVGPQAAVNADAQVGRGCIVNTGAIVEHDCRVGDFSHLSPGTVLGGGVTLGARCWVCLGAAVSDHVKIGDRTVVGAGAAVLSSIPGNVLAAGVPARIQRRHSAAQV